MNHLSQSVDRPQQSDSLQSLSDLETFCYQSNINIFLNLLWLKLLRSPHTLSVIPGNHH